jgi:hypothetical protein
MPEFEPREAVGNFHWDPNRGELIPINQSRLRGVTLLWRVSDADGPADPENPRDPNDPFNKRVRQVGAIAWPQDPEIHAAGAPVDVSGAVDEATGTALSLPTVPSTGGGIVVGGRFQNDKPGTNTLLWFTGGDTFDPAAYPQRFVVVRTVDPTATPQEAGACSVGTPLAPPRTADASGDVALRSGHVA